MQQSQRPTKQVIRVPGVPLPSPEFAHAVRTGNWVFTSGILASDFESGLPEQVRSDPGLPLHGEHPLIRESEWILDQVETVLGAAGASFETAVRVDQFPTSREVINPYHLVRRRRVPPPRPASTSVGVQSLIWKDCSIEVEMVALIKESGIKKEGIETDKIPQPIGGYVPAIRAGDFVFLAGQLPSDFKTGIPPEADAHPAFWEGNRIDRQTRYVLNNIKLTLEAAGSSLENVVKAQVYLADLRDLPRMDRVWREYFPSNPPARSVLPGLGYGALGSLIEINIVALTDAGRTLKEVFSPEDETPFLHESPVVRAGDLVFLSGLVAADRRGLISSARVSDNYLGISARRQADHILETADRLLRAAGSSASGIVRVESFFSDLHDALPVGAAFRERFATEQPARTTVGVPELHVPGCSLLMDIWAVAD